MPVPPAAAVVNTKSTADDAWKVSWDHIVKELVDMGFENVNTNKQKVVEHNGDLKSTVTALTTEERAKRQV